MEEAKPQHNIGQWNLNWNLARRENEKHHLWDGRGARRGKNGEYSRRQGGKLPSLKNASTNLNKKFPRLKKLKLPLHTSYYPISSKPGTILWYFQVHEHLKQWCCVKYLVTLLCQMWAGFDEPGKLLLIIGRLMSSPPVCNNFPNYQVSLRGTGTAIIITTTITITAAIIIINGNNHFWTGL